MTIPWKRPLNKGFGFGYVNTTDGPTKQWVYAYLYTRNAEFEATYLVSSDSSKNL